MDNLTHSLFGATLARTPLGRTGPGTTLALVLASNAPDIDIVATAGGALTYLQWHRGPTHGPLGVLALGVVTAAIVSLIMRTLGRGDPASPPASFRGLVGVSIVGVLMHVAMDLPTSYGTRPFSPFSWTWFALDWMPIIDVYLLAALAAGLYFGRRSQSARQRNAVIALAFMVLNYAVRATTHHSAVSAAPRVFGPLLPEPCPGVPAPELIVDRWPRPLSEPLPPDGRRCLVEVAATPTFVSPFRWRVIAQTSNAYELHDVNLLDRRTRTAPQPGDAMYRLSVRYANQWTPAARTAAEARTARVFLGFSRFPAVRSVRNRDGSSTVRFTDIRFVDSPVARDRPRSSRDGLFTAVVELAPNGAIIEERLGP